MCSAHRSRAVVLSFGDPGPFAERVRTVGAALIIQVTDVAVDLIDDLPSAPLPSAPSPTGRRPRRPALAADDEGSGQCHKKREERAMP